MTSQIAAARALIAHPEHPQSTPTRRRIAWAILRTAQRRATGRAPALPARRFPEPAA
jgi:hypothetical protein